MMWGVAIYDNIRKFIQFQLTINIVICTITIIGSALTGHNPLNVIQMLWVNLIMDILGAIAIGTEKYTKGSKFRRLTRSGEGKDKKDKRILILKENWRQIVVHSIYQITVMSLLMFFGQYIFFDKPFSIQRPPYGQVDEFESDRQKLDTICFHSFVLMNVFNMINCRVLDTADTTEKNVFKSLC